MTSISNGRITLKREHKKALEYAVMRSELVDWLSRCTNMTVDVDGIGDFLQNGVVLCEICESMIPGSIAHINRPHEVGSMKYKYTENITAFLSAIEKEEVPLFDNLHLYEQKNIPKVVVSLHYWALLAEKFNFEPHIEHISPADLNISFDELNYLVALLEEAGIDDIEHCPIDVNNRSWDIVVDADQHIKVSSEDSSQQAETTNMQVLSENIDLGSTKHITLKREHKKALEYAIMRAELADWLSRCTNMTVDVNRIGDFLQNGVVLCEIFESMIPGSIAHINRPHEVGSMKYKYTENITAFLSAIEKEEVPLFDNLHLYEQKNIPKVVVSLHYWALLAETFNFEPCLNRMTPADIQISFQELNRLVALLEEAGIDKLKPDSLEDEYVVLEHQDMVETSELNLSIDEEASTEIKRSLSSLSKHKATSISLGNIDTPTDNTDWDGQQPKDKWGKTVLRYTIVLLFCCCICLAAFSVLGGILVSDSEDFRSCNCYRVVSACNAKVDSLSHQMALLKSNHKSDLDGYAQGYKQRDDVIAIKANMIKELTKQVSMLEADLANQKTSLTTLIAEKDRELSLAHHLLTGMEDKLKASNTYKRSIENQLFDKRTYLTQLSDSFSEIEQEKEILIGLLLLSAICLTTVLMCWVCQCSCCRRSRTEHPKNY